MRIIHITCLDLLIRLLEHPNPNFGFFVGWMSIDLGGIIRLRIVLLLLPAVRTDC